MPESPEQLVVRAEFPYPDERPEKKPAVGDEGSTKPKNEEGPVDADTTVVVVAAGSKWIEDNKTLLLGGEPWVDDAWPDSL